MGNSSFFVVICMFKAHCHVTRTADHALQLHPATMQNILHFLSKLNLQLRMNWVQRVFETFAVFFSQDY